jgi:uncharacterized membrane protein
LKDKTTLLRGLLVTALLCNIGFLWLSQNCYTRFVSISFFCILITFYEIIIIIVIISIIIIIIIFIIIYKNSATSPKLSARLWVKAVKKVEKMARKY